MGFRDIQNYNNARQRLLYKVFSAKYFPNGNILEVSVHPRSSFAWRTILQARDVINKGVICKVGDEGSTKIWEHNWLQDPSNSKVVSPRNNIMCYMLIFFNNLTKYLYFYNKNYV